MYLLEGALILHGLFFEDANEIGRGTCACETPKNHV